MNQENIGKFIAKLRKEKKLTQEQLAEKLGVTDKSISRWENGKTMPDYSVVQQLCEILEVTVVELLNGEVDKTNEGCIIDLLWVKEKLKTFKFVIIGLLLMNISEMLRNLLEYINIDVNNFTLGMLHGAVTGTMLFGGTLFVYGVAKYVKDRKIKIKKS